MFYLFLISLDRRVHKYWLEYVLSVTNY